MYYMWLTLQVRDTFDREFLSSASVMVNASPGEPLYPKRTGVYQMKLFME